MDSAGVAVNIDASLFSPRLQQLHLANGDVDEEVRLCASGVGHLSALQQLTLDGVVLEEPDAQELAESLGSLQQLRAYHLPSNQLGPRLQDARHLVPLAHKLTEYAVWLIDEDVSILSSCVHLTRLVLAGIVPDNTAAALAALTGLRELGLRGFVAESTVEVVQQVAGMAQLCSLQLDVWEGHHIEALASSLAQCSQLTALVLLMRGDRSVNADSMWVPVLQQLTGLQCLTVQQQLVVEKQVACLATLTQLTRLCVYLRSLAADALLQGCMKESTGREDLLAWKRWFQRCRPSYEAAAQRVIALVQHQLPAGLQQAMFSLQPDVDCDSFVPKCWQLPASASGCGQVMVWVEQQDRSAAGWARPLRPCPHLAGVWELQGPAQSRPWQLMLPDV
jgi:hypothetical protein